MKKRPLWYDCFILGCGIGMVAIVSFIMASEFLKWVAS